LNILIDSSVWIDYFRSGKQTGFLDSLIDKNLIATNSLILAELIPALRAKNHSSLVRLLCNIRRFEINIDWNEVIDYSTKCIKTGINGIGVSDLLIVQNAKQNNLVICALDNHFRKMVSVLDFSIFTLPTT